LKIKKIEADIKIGVGGDDLGIYLLWPNEIRYGSMLYSATLLAKRDDP
jgi:hypothetical protein